MKNVFHFSEVEKKRIEDAVKDLEKDSSGEIVPYFIQASDNYLFTCWKIAAICGIIPSVVVGFMAYKWLIPDWATPLDISLSIGLMIVLGFIIPLASTRIRILLTDDDIVNERVLQKAETAFLEEGIYKTIEHTGILIFISYAEHKVIVLGDEGINAKVSNEQWEEVVNAIIQGIKSKKVCDGIVDSIGKCKKLLLDNGFTVREDDTNELSDHLRI